MKRFTRDVYLENSFQQIEPEKLYPPIFPPAHSVSVELRVIRNFTVSNNTVIRLGTLPPAMCTRRALFTRTVNVHHPRVPGLLHSLQHDAATTFPKVFARLSDFFSTLGFTAGTNKTKAFTHTGTGFCLHRA